MGSVPAIGPFLSPRLGELEIEDARQSIPPLQYSTSYARLKEGR